MNIKNNYGHVSTERKNHVDFIANFYFLIAQNLSEMAA